MLPEVSNAQNAWLKPAQAQYIILFISVKLLEPVVSIDMFPSEHSQLFLDVGIEESLSSNISYSLESQFQHCLNKLPLNQAMPLTCNCSNV